MAYLPFINDNIRDCYFNNEQVLLFIIWMSRISTIKKNTSQQVSLALVLEEKVTSPSVPKSDSHVELGLGFSDGLSRTSLMTVWELMKSSWCSSPNADVILRATQNIERESNSECNLRDLKMMHNLMTEASRSSREKTVELPGWRTEDLVEPVSCLARTCGIEGRLCGRLDCLKLLSRQHKQLVILFESLLMKTKTETELFADCHGEIEVNLVTALGF